MVLRAHRRFNHWIKSSICCRRLDLRFGSEENTSFKVDFSCRPNEQPIIVAIRMTKHYIFLKSDPCP